MRIIWSEEAIESVDNTADYIEDNFGINRSLGFTTKCKYLLGGRKETPEEK